MFMNAYGQYKTQRKSIKSVKLVKENRKMLRFVPNYFKNQKNVEKSQS